MAVKCMGAAGFRPCPTTVIGWKTTEEMHPVKRALVQQIRDWLEQWWQAEEEEKVGITSAWRQTWDIMAKVNCNTRWKRVKGPLSATIAVLMEIGWKPAQPNLWVSRQGTQVASRMERGDQATIMAAIGDEVSRILWARAADHEGGGGLEKGQPDLGPARRAEHFAESIQN